MGLNILLIQDSFNAIKPHLAEVVEHFQEELLRKHSDARAFVNSGVEEQEALAQKITYIVEHLDEPGQLKGFLMEKCMMDPVQGVKPEHFAWVGDAMIATLSFYFDAQWTDELSQNWSAAYGFIATEILKGFDKDSGKVVEIKKEDHQQKSPKHLAQSIVQEMFRIAIEEEMASPTFQKLVMKKAQEVLRRAFEAEAETFLVEMRSRSKSA